MRALVIGTGAAGNKAAIDLLEAGVIESEDLVLVNSTLRDIPEQYRNYAVQLSLESEGCGKERSRAKEITLKALQESRLNLEQKFNVYHQKIIIIASIEGGTGSGSAPIIAKYCSCVFKDENENPIPIEVIGFKGFEDDTRGLANTIEWFQAMDPSWKMQVICNDKFLLGNNRIKAEKAANAELVQRVKIMLGQVIIDGSHNIDPADLYKITATPGYSTIEYAEVNQKIKSYDQFNDIIKEMLDETKTLEPENAGVKRLGVIVNMNESSQDYVDYSFRAIKDRIGKPYETFTHIQYDKEQPEFVALMISGMKMPIDEVKAVYNKYLKESEEVENNSNDDFFSQIKSLQGNSKDNQFNMFGGSSSKSTSGRDDFFKQFSTQKPDKKGTSVKQIEEDSEY